MDRAPGQAEANDPAGLRAARGAEPLPPPLQAFDLWHPAVPPELHGLRILHIADLHARARGGLRGPRRPRGMRALLDAIRSTRSDLACLTGDYADRAGDEDAAADAVAQLADAINAGTPPRLGTAGSFGNHDHHLARARLRERVPGVRWLEDASVTLRDRGGATLRLLGTGEPEDLLDAALSGEPTDDTPFTIALAHDPVAIFPACDLGIPLVLSGHTHGGQIRTHPRRLLHTSTDLRGHEATGVIARRDTMCCITRGVGVTVLGLRFNCPPQACLYTLRRSPPTEPTDDGVRTLLAW